MKQGNAKMLDTAEKGNMEQVRDALVGITGVAKAPPIIGPNRYLVVVRNNHEFDSVDSFRRNMIPAYWASYEELLPSKKVQNGTTGRSVRRVGILPGLIFVPVDAAPDMQGLLHRIVGAIDFHRTYSGAPFVVEDADVRTIQRIEAGLNTPSKIVTHKFKVGEKVRFTDDLDCRWPPGKIIKLAREGRIIVEVDAMGRKMPITVFPFQIEKM
jgi:transcription antitermination factor NusG